LDQISKSSKLKKSEKLDIISEQIKKLENKQKELE